MKIKINITLTDQTSEEEIIARGRTRAEMTELYTDAFRGLLQAVAAEGVETDIRVEVTDNTKED